MENSENVKVSKEEVIAKLKDDGDFDRLRRKIIQKLKNNDELRENIVSIVKPRQLSDDIYQEVGESVMSRISEGVWGIIRSSDGMQSEISDTVRSVYDKLANPEDSVDGGYSGRVGEVQAECSDDGLVVDAAVSGGVGIVVDNKVKEPAEFSVACSHEGESNHEVEVLHCEKGGVVEQQDKMETEDVDRVVAPGVSTNVEHKEGGDGSDEDPDVPPGFG